MPEPMKCPFREKDGEFGDCIGKACMAYCEFENVPHIESEPDKPREKIIRMCKRIPHPVIYGGCV